MLRAGSRTAGGREPRQVRKEAAVSGAVPGVAGAPGWSWLCVFRLEGSIRSRWRGKIKNGGFFGHPVFLLPEDGGWRRENNCSPLSASCPPAISNFAAGKTLLILLGKIPMFLLAVHRQIKSIYVIFAPYGRRQEIAAARRNMTSQSG